MHAEQLETEIKAAAALLNVSTVRLAAPDTPPDADIPIEGRKTPNPSLTPVLLALADR